MSYADVCEAVESLQRKYCERDPFRLSLGTQYFIANRASRHFTI